MAGSDDNWEVRAVALAEYLAKAAEELQKLVEEIRRNTLEGEQEDERPEHGPSDHGDR
jgi:hypothetical protein